MTSGIGIADDTLSADMRAMVFDHSGDETFLKIGGVESPPLTSSDH
jgi:hypothetical protein